MNSHVNDMKWNTVGAFGYLGLHALSIIVIARLAGAEAVGVFLLAQAVGYPLSRLSGLNYHDINATESGLSGLRHHLLNVSLVAVPLTTVVLVLWLWLTDGQLRSVGPALILAQVLQAYAQVAQGRLIRLRHFRTAANYELLRGLASVASFLTGIVCFDSLQAAAMLLALCWTAIVLFEIEDARRLSARQAAPASSLPAEAMQLRERFRYAVSDSVMGLQASSIRLCVGAILGEVAVGIFGATVLLTRLIQPAAAACSRTFMPRLADDLAQHAVGAVRQQFARINRATLSLVAVFTAAGYWLTPPLIEATLGAALRPSAGVAAIIMSGAAPLISSRFHTQMLTALRDRRGVERASWVALAASLLLAPPLTFYYGLTGAAIALSASFLLRYLVAAHAAHRALQAWQAGKKPTIPPARSTIDPIKKVACELQKT